MAVTVDKLPFFPNIYNEDWLFPAILMDQDVAKVSLVTDLVQTNENFHITAPSSGGVELEEFGDLFAEGVMRAIRLNRSRNLPMSDLILREEYWEKLFQLRQQYIQKLQTKFNAHVEIIAVPKKVQDEISVL